MIEQATIKPTSTTPNAMLLQLPGELRNRIIRLSLLQDTPIDLLRLQWRRDRTGYDPVLIPEPDLSRTCRSLRPEVLSIYYGENTFNLGTGHHILSMHEIPSQLSLWIRRLRESGCEEFLSRVRMEVNCEILGPKASNRGMGMGFYRDFWEVLVLEVWKEGHHGVGVRMSGDPSFEEVCICGIEKGKWSGSIGEVLEKASELYFRTTELRECEDCGKPRLDEVRNVRSDGVVYLDC